MHSSIRSVTLALGVSLALAAAPAKAGPDKKIVRLWKSKCASCHGEDGKADTEKGKQMKIGDLTSADFQKKRTDEEMKKVINEGLKEEKGGVKKEMDPYKEELKPEQVDALVAFIRELQEVSPDRDRAEPTAPTRRRFIDWLMGLGFTGWFAGVAYPVVRYLTPLAGSVAGAVKLSAEDLARLDRGQFAIVRSGDARVIVLQVEGALRALDARCTHEGCTVQYVPGERVVWCACHNGRFDLEGRVLAGPPPRPLGKWIATRDQDGGVTVTREKV